VKSHVSMEAKICPICVKKFSTDTILLHKGLKQVLERETVTGYDLCPECRKLNEDGYIAFIGVDEEKSDKKGDNIDFDGAWRTGTVSHVRREFAEKIFDSEEDFERPFMFCSDQVIEMLMGMQVKEVGDVEIDKN